MNKEAQELLEQGFAALELAKKLLGEAHASLEATGWKATFCPGEDRSGPKWVFSKEGEETFFVPTLTE